MMKTSNPPSSRAATLAAGLSLLSILTLAVAPVPAQAGSGEDSLVCSRVKDGYAKEGYAAAFWLRSEAYGELSWCNFQVKAVEHCVPVEPVLHDTTSPYEMRPGPELAREYTCYRIRCMNGEGATFLGTSVPLSDMFGARVGEKPRATRVCLPN